MSNKLWLSEEVRETYLDFFVQKKHRRLPSFSLVPFNDPTLLLVAAGMAPFKAEFAGIAKPVSPRITTCQKCVRADDLERVGYTSRHHTFFEMLGNFSFGDYFKEEAILWAWELLTQYYGIPKEKLWVSVHTDDDEAHQLWEKEAGVPSARIVRLADNFWGPIGATGTCGPDSEIYYDRGIDFSCRRPNCKPGCDNKIGKNVECERYLELWNLVFTMYHKDETGKMHELPQKNIDTGAGLERITMVLQGKNSPYETDLFEKMMSRIPKASDSVARRIIADHLRAVTFMAGDGIVPSNEGRGYVLRNFLRRAKAFLIGLGAGTATFNELGIVDAVIETMGKIYPELQERQKQIHKIIDEEEQDFAGKTEAWLVSLQKEIRGKYPVGALVSGEVLFRYHDELGLRFEYAKTSLESWGYQIDEEGFYAEMEKQRTRSRGSHAISDVMAKAIETQTQTLSATEFLGYQATEAPAKIMALFKGKENVDALQAGEEGIAVLDKTPFYAESGGQVGDTGKFTWDSSSAMVSDTQKNEGDVFFHKIKIEKGKLTKGMPVHVIVDSERRKQIRKHHTATHLLHAAIQKVLGPHALQAGSFVCDQYLRLDFSHPKGLTQEELLKIERLANEKVTDNISVNTAISTQEEAKKQGAMAIFGEKYGESVRVIIVNEFSKELCGGTHVAATGEIGPVVITKESAIAKGTRRLEAKAGKAAVEFITELQTLQTQLTDRLKIEMRELIPQVDSLMSQKQDQEKEIRRLRNELAGHKALPLLEKSRLIHDLPLIAAEIQVQEKEELRAMVDFLKGKMTSGIILLASADHGKVSLACGVTPDLVKKGFSAVDMIKAVSPVVGGGGGGRADLAEAGGKNPDKIHDALLEAEKILESKAIQP